MRAKEIIGKGSGSWFDLRFELGPAGIEPLDFGRCRRNRGETLGERPVVGRHGRIGCGLAGSFEHLLGLEDARLDLIPLALLEVAETPGLTPPG